MPFSFLQNRFVFFFLLIFFISAVVEVQKLIWNETHSMHLHKLYLQSCHRRNAMQLNELNMGKFVFILYKFCSTNYSRSLCTKVQITRHQPIHRTYHLDAILLALYTLCAVCWRLELLFHCMECICGFYSLVISTSYRVDGIRTLLNA